MRCPVTTRSPWLAKATVGMMEDWTVEDLVTKRESRSAVVKVHHLVVVMGEV
jgi:hypothetical protein